MSLAPSPPDPDAPDLAQSHALDAVRQHLRRQLPAALCPVLVPVEGLPRGSSGKVDLAALESAPLTPATRAPAGPAAPFAALFARVLGLDAVGEEDSFFDLGGDSIAALELLAEAALVGLPLPADALYRAPTPAALARHLGPPAASIADLTARAVEALREASPGRRDHGASAIEHALVTGATGFFGAWLLAELLARTKWTFHTLVRAPDRAAAQDRVERALAAVSRVTGRAAPAGRVVAWPGDATRERLGLAAAEHERLHRQVGAVIHGAAELHLLKPYEALREANVTAAARVSQLGADRAMFHHISTLSVLVATDHPAATLDERADPRDARRVYGGYAQSKWAAEEALRRGGHDAFHRLGLLTGDTLTGRPAAACPLAQLLRGLAALGCVPRGDHAALRVDITPVDHAARAVATLIAQGPMRSAAHVASARGASLAGLLAALRAEGARCDEVSADEFLRRARRQLPFAVTMAMLSLPRLLGGGEVQRDVDLFQLTGRTLDCAGTERRTGLPHPAIDETLLRRYARAALEEP